MLSGTTIEPVPPLISEWTQGWGVITEGMFGIAPSSGTFEAANRAIYQPFYVPTVCVAKRMWWVNGSTVNGNVEAGIYADADHKPGAKLITTGSVAQGSATSIQFADITDTTLRPGLWWLYLSSSSGTATCFRSAVPTSALAGLSKFQQAGVPPGSAPATAAPDQSSGLNIFLYGIDTRGVG